MLVSLLNPQPSVFEQDRTQNPALEEFQSRLQDHLPFVEDLSFRPLISAIR